MIDLDTITCWYSGKALNKIEDFVIPTLRTAEAQGFWPKGVSRSVRAGLNKMTAAKKLVREWQERGLVSGINSSRHLRGEGWSLCFAMEYGRLQDVPQLLRTIREKDLPRLARSREEHTALLKAIEWVVTFNKIAALLDLLDSRRPPRTLVLGTLSPLVAGHLGEHLGLKLGTTRFPKTKAKWVEFIDSKTQKKYEMCVIEILWPKGTVHGSSKYQGTVDNSQCEACGHAIKSPYNWVPILIDNKAGIPHSFWTGRDCAEKLFGVRVEGEGMYEERMKS